MGEDLGRGEVGGLGDGGAEMVRECGEEDADDCAEGTAHVIDYREEGSEECRDRAIRFGAYLCVESF